MAKLKMGGALVPLLLVLMLGVFAPSLRAQNDNFQPDPKQPITVDFVQKDIHTVMHYIALRSGLQIIVEGTVQVNLTVMFRNIVPRVAIQSICKANKLDFIEDGKIIIIKARPQETQLANVVKGEVSGRFNVNFLSQPLVEAIMEVASVTGAQAFIPSIPPQTQELPKGGPQPGAEGQSNETTGRLTEYVTSIQKRQISMYMREALPKNIMQRLAELGGLELSVETMKDAVNGNDVGYRFKYLPLRSPSEEPNAAPTNQPLVSKSWVIPGAKMSEVKNQLTPLLSTRGKIVVDDTTSYLMVYDVQSRLDDVTKFLDPLVDKMQAYVMNAEAEKGKDKMLVREYRLIRDPSQGDLLGSIQAMLTEEGKIVMNPDRNTVIVYEHESKMQSIDRVMRALDTAPDQVLITAKLIEVSLDTYLGYGLQMFTSHSADNLNNGRFTASSQDTASGTAQGLFGQPTGFDPFFATFSNPRIDVRLELLANEGKVKTLSQPTQMVSNKQQAHIEVGQEIPYLESSGTAGGTTTASVSFKDVSIAMDVTPTVLENGLIRLDVDVSVREVIGNVAIEGNNTPILSKRQSKTNVFIRDGETLVMGGLMRERERNDENGLPFLKDIPFLGYLFKSENKTTSKTDLLFFLRPQIVNANIGPQISEIGERVERDLRPLIYEEGDQKASNIRDGRYRKLEKASKPAWYNDKTRPKHAKDVKPDA